MIYSLPIDITHASLLDVPIDAIKKHIRPLDLIRISSLNKGMKYQLKHDKDILNKLFESCGNAVQLDFTSPLLASVTEHEFVDSECLDDISNGYSTFGLLLKKLKLALDPEHSASIINFAMKEPEIEEIEVFVNAETIHIDNIAEAMKMIRMKRLVLVDATPGHTFPHEFFQKHQTLEEITVRFYKSGLQEYIQQFLNSAAQNDNIQKLSIRAGSLDGVEWDNLNPNLKHLFLDSPDYHQQFTLVLPRVGKNLKSLGMRFDCLSADSDELIGNISPDFSFEGLEKLEICSAPYIRSNWERIVKAKETIRELVVPLYGPDSFFSVFMNENTVLSTLRVGSCSAVCTKLIANSSITTLEFYNTVHDIDFILRNVKNLEHLTIPKNMDLVSVWQYTPPTLKTLTFKFRKTISGSIINLVKDISKVKPDLLVNGVPIDQAIRELGKNEAKEYYLDDQRYFKV
jgi:hypothetical protein